VTIEPGYLVYVGSALGPGGIRARVARHARKSKKPHWHIDYLRPYLSLAETWWKTAPDRWEHDWAALLAARLDVAHPRFGASDCRCASHLFFAAPDRPAVGTLDPHPDVRVHAWR
jgi:Uri superfamily endonuclease